MLLYKDADQILYFIRQCVSHTHLISRSLFLIEKAAGGRFKWAEASNRILYSEPANRSRPLLCLIRSVIFKAFQFYVQMCLRKACYETALNASLLLYSFFPQTDPTGQLLLLPYLALITRRYATVERMMEAGLAVGTLLLAMLPNWSFDYGLALYRENKPGAREQIRASLRRWPQVLRMLAENAVGAGSGVHRRKSVCLCRAR